jgi:chemotaxis protein CheD
MAIFTKTLPPLPAPLPGFEHVRRIWNDTYQMYAARILPGEYYVTRNEEGVYTTLGSCVAACMRDRVKGIGGMNHFMLPFTGAIAPDAIKASGIGAATRYGNYAMEHLVNEIMRNGGRRENLEVKVFGGGRVLANMTDVGERNIAFVRDYLRMEGLAVVSEDMGNIFPRMVVYFPSTGRVRVKRLRSLHNNLIANQEMDYLDSLKSKPASGDVELFF